MRLGDKVVLALIALCLVLPAPVPTGGASRRTAPQ